MLKYSYVFTLNPGFCPFRPRSAYWVCPHLNHISGRTAAFPWITVVTVWTENRMFYPVVLLLLLRKCPVQSVASSPAPRFSMMFLSSFFPKCADPEHLIDVENLAKNNSDDSFSRWMCNNIQSNFQQSHWLVTRVTQFHPQLAVPDPAESQTRISFSFFP